MTLKTYFNKLPLKKASKCVFIWVKKNALKNSMQSFSFVIHDITFVIIKQSLPIIIEI